MRELEFLPDWYNQVRRRKRVIAFEGWLLLALILSIGTWLVLAQRNVATAERNLKSLRGQLVQTQSEQRLLEEQLRLRKQLQAQEELIASLGYPVEMTRLLQTLDTLMPREMSLTDFTCETQERTRQAAGVAVARATKDSSNQIDRTLKVKIVGVAPSDVDLANFLAGLSSVPFFEQVAPTYSSQKMENGHVLREFEVTFYMNLNLQPVGS